MSFTLKFYPESRFGGFSDIDGTVSFYNRVNSLIKEGDTILDVGCGRGEYQEDECGFRRKLRIMRGKCRRVIGMDVDTHAQSNPFIDEFYLIENDLLLAIENNSIDLIICDYVLEHVQFPDKLFKEFNRVLKVGGVVCARTPNFFSYFGIISNSIPDRLHAKLVGWMQGTRKPEDVFPKFYRCNSIFRIKKLMQTFGFEGLVYGFESEPAYFSFSSFIYGMVKIFHQLTPKYFSTQLYLFARKKFELKAISQ